MRKPTRAALIATIATLGVMPAAHASAPAPVTATPQVSPPLPDIVEQTAHAITAHHGALSVEDRAYGATFDVGGFALTPRRTARNADVVAGFVPLERAPALRISTVGATSAWRASGDVASRALAPGFTERVTARDGALEWDVVVDAPQPAGIKVIARTDAPGTPARTAHDIRWTGPDAKTVVMGELIVRDATGRELYRTVPTLIPGGVVLEVPATALTTAVYPVTLDPTVGPEFYTSDPSYGAPLGDQKKPAIASNGTISLVVWTDMRSGDQDIYGTRVDRTGAVLDTGSIPIATAKGAQGNPSVAWDGTEFFVAWDWADPAATGIGTDIWAARVGVDGTVIDPNGIQVTNQVVGNQTVPKVASDLTGSFIVWQDTRSGNADIYGARVNGAQVQDLTGLPIATGAAEQSSPTICSGTGGYFVAWVDGNNLLDALVDPVAGTIAMGPGVSLSATTVYLFPPSVAFSGQSTLVVWVRSPDLNTFEVLSARISTNLAVQSSTVLRTISFAGVAFREPSVGYDGINFIVTYAEGAAGADLKLSRIRPSDGSAIDTITMAGSGQIQDAGAVVFDGNSTLVVWEDNLSGVYDIYGGRLTTAGAKLDAAGFLVSKSANEQTDLEIAWTGQNFFIVWSDRRGGSTSYDIYGALVSASGDLLTPGGIQICTVPGNQTAPKVAWNGSRFLVSWIDNSSSPARVYATPVTSSGTVVIQSGTQVSHPSYGAVSHDLATDGASFLEVYHGLAGSQSIIWSVVITSAGSVGPNVNFATAPENREPAVAWGGSNYLVTWTTRINPTYYLMGDRISSAGVALDGATGFVISSPGVAEIASSVASNGTDWLVTWNDFRSFRDYDIYGSRVGSDGSITEPNGFPIAADRGDQTVSTIGYDGAAYVVAWQSKRSDLSWEILAARLRGPAVDGAEITVGSESTEATKPSLTGGPLGRVAASYQRFTPASNYGSTRGVIRFVDHPANDAFASAQVLSPAAGNVSGLSGSKEQFEPDHAGNPGGRSVWYKWVAPAGGTASFDTMGSHFDTLLAAYTGSRLSNLQGVASNDDASVDETSSRIVFDAVRNRTYFVAVDGKNGAGGLLDLAWVLTVDTTAPQTSITSGPTPRDNQDPMFTFISDEPLAHFQCSIDAGAFVDCTSPRSYLGVAEGSHTFNVQAIDPNDNADPTPDIWNWVIDRTPPETRITSGPDGETSATAATFTFDSPSDLDASFECGLDGAAYAVCSSPRTYTRLSASDHNLYVRAVDVAGNVDSSPSLSQWTVDPPDTRIIDGPASITSATTATFHFDSPNETDVTFECKLDLGTFAECPSPKSLINVTAGIHRFSVRALHSADNKDLTPALYEWTVDGSPPIVRFESPTPGLWVFGAPVGPPNSGTRIVVIGDVQVVVRATDPQSGAASVAFTVDEVTVPSGMVSHEDGTDLWSFHFVPAPSTAHPLEHTIIATAVNGVGNSGSDRRTVTGVPGGFI